jgi:hypothetical protein
MDNLLLAFSDVQIRPKVGFAPAAVVAIQLLWNFVVQSLQFHSGVPDVSLHSKNVGPHREFPGL